MNKSPSAKVLSARAKLKEVREEKGQIFTLAYHGTSDARTSFELRPPDLVITGGVKILAIYYTSIKWSIVSC